MAFDRQAAAILAASFLTRCNNEDTKLAAGALRNALTEIVALEETLSAVRHERDLYRRERDAGREREAALRDEIGVVEAERDAANSELIRVRALVPEAARLAKVLCAREALCWDSAAETEAELASVLVAAQILKLEASVTRNDT